MGGQLSFTDNVKRFVVLLSLFLPLTAFGQTKSFVGTVTAFRAESAEVDIKPDSGQAVAGKLTTDTLAQRIAPGEKDLKKAEAIQVTEVAKGDRVLVTLEADSTRIRRIVVMSANDIAHKNEADRQDWQKRGVAGVVAAKNGNQLTLKNKTVSGEAQTTVTFTDATSIKRYAPDSVKFADAQPSKLADISLGDQVRARGEKSADGSSVKAEDVVFGTFVIEAGAIGSVDLEAKEIKVKELGTNKLLTVKLTADSQIKQMMSMPPMGGGAGMPQGGPPNGGRGGMPQGGPPMAGGPGGPGGGRGGFDINQMIDRIPVAKLEDLKPGSTVVITSTKGAKSDHVTAILLLSNADMLIQMASAMNGSGRGGAGGPGGMQGGMGGMQSGDLGGLMGLGIGGMNQ